MKASVHWKVEIHHHKIIFKIPGANFEALRIGENRDRDVYIRGTAARDEITVNGHTSDVFLWIEARAGDDVITNNTGCWLHCTAGSGRDTIQGGSGDELLLGEEGNDIIRGGGGNDILFGGPGADNLDGQGGDDILIGGKGYYPPGHNSVDPHAIPDLDHDTLTGGGGQDWFFDRYYDYNP